MDIDFGSGDVFWAVFWLSLWGAWVWMLITIWMHVIRDPELSGVIKAVWTAIILLLPLLGVLLYLGVRGARVGDNVSPGAENLGYSGDPRISAKKNA